jgi:hypothetical protein
MLLVFIRYRKDSRELWQFKIDDVTDKMEPTVPGLRLAASLVLQVKQL